MAQRIQYCKKRDLHYQSLGGVQRLLVMVTLLATLIYMHWRLETMNPDALFFSLILYSAEIYGVIGVLLHLFMVYKLPVRTPPVPNEHLSVDVFITIYNEKIDIVRRTAIAAKQIDYPHTVYLLDDGNREEIRQLAEQLECKYLARTTNKDAKAGNLNNGLKHSTGEFIVVLDVDHAPMRTFIDRTLGYFVDDKVAFVQTPQDFYNLDSFQHRGEKDSGQMWTEQSLFFRVIQRGKDYWNAAFFCGSCAIIRRSALERIGGFATGTITEDLHTSIRLHKAGFKSVYHAESLAFGIAPAQISAFLKQRKRWGEGAMQVWRKEGILFAGSMLTIPQRLNYVASVLTYFDGWQRLLYYVTPALVLFTGVLPIVATAEEFLLYFVPYFLLNILMFEEVSRGYGRAIYIEQYNMARFYTFCSATAGWLKLHSKFVVTNKSMVGEGGALFELIPQLSIILFNVFAVVYGLVIHYTQGNHLETFALWLNIFWSMVCLGIASSVVRFAYGRAKYKRNDYRFKLPLKAEMNYGPAAHKQIYSIQIVNISGTGVLFRVPKHVKLAHDEEISGTLQLPWELPFKARIRSIHPDEDFPGTIAVGCAFDWEDEKAMQKLEGFLYGSDMEWRTNRISERMPTLFERIFSSNSARAKARRATIENMQKTGNAYVYNKQRGRR